ncbi:hypothetical protein I5535_19915 [Rhodobacteraceae bacterium F11138]|nr:hypothetical protein [Rhodobacteraceae bacterium F11138]
MADAALNNAVKARDELHEKIAEAAKQIEEWKAKAARAERFIADWEEFSGQTAPARAVAHEDVQVTEYADDIVERRMSAKAKNPKKEDVAKAAVEVIREHGEPMSRTEVRDALAEAGVVIHGTRPEVVLQTMLWRMNDVVAHIKGHGYWPADTPHPPSGYDPDAPDDDEEIDVLDEDTARLV